MSLLADRRSGPPRSSAGRRSRRRARSGRCRRRRRCRRSRPPRTSKRRRGTASRPRSSRTCRSSTVEQRLAGVRRRLLDPQEHLAPDHQLREAAPRSRPRAGTVLDRLAAPQHGDPVGDLEHLVQLVRDEDDRLALRLQRLDDREQLARLLRRQHGGGLVEDEDVGAAVERLQDLDALLLADADRLDRGRRAAPRARTAARARATRFSAASMVDERAAVRLDAEHDVLGDRHHRDEHEVLVHHPDRRGRSPRAAS